MKNRRRAKLYVVLLFGFPITTCWTGEVVVVMGEIPF